MHNSNYALKFILPALERLQKGEVVDCTWVDGSFSYNIIPKSSENLLLLEFKWEKMENNNTHLNKTQFLDSYTFPLNI